MCYRWLSSSRRAACRHSATVATNTSNLKYTQLQCACRNTSSFLSKMRIVPQNREKDQQCTARALLRTWTWSSPVAGAHGNRSNQPQGRNMLIRNTSKVQSTMSSSIALVLLSLFGRLCHGLLLLHLQTWLCIISMANLSMRSASTGCKKYSVIIVIGSEPITGRFIFKKTAFSHYSSSNQCLLLTGCQLSFGCRLFMLLQLLTLHWWPPSSSWKTMQMVERVHMMMQMGWSISASNE